MLPTSTAKDSKLVVSCAIALGLGQGSNRPAHGLIGNLEETKSQVFHRLGLGPGCSKILVNLNEQPLERCLGTLIVQWLVLRGAEYLGEVLCLQAAKHKIGIGDRERASLAVGYGSGVGTR